MMMMKNNDETPSFETSGLSGMGIPPLFINEDDDDDDDDDEQSYYDDDIDDGDDLFSIDTKIPTTVTSTTTGGEEMMMKDNDDDDDSNNDQYQQNSSPLDQILASEMNKLSVEERTQALEDVHGVSESFELDPSTIQCKLNELDLLINNNKTKEYKLAESLSSNYVQNQDFRLQFLQADLFDVQAAAKRLFKFVHYKYKLFGKDLLVKDNITIDDLNQQDLQLLYEGCLQIPLEKDRAGRPILLLFQHLATTKHHGSMLRVAYYVYMSLLRGTSASDGIRQKGLVCIFYNTHPNPNKVHPKLVWRALKLRQALPIKTVACHACSLDKTRPVFRYILNMWQKMTKSYLHARLRRHSGTDSECRAQLRAFGLPVDCFPIDDHGKMNLQYHQEWIRRRRMIEEEVEDIKVAATALVSSSSSAAATTTLAEENRENIISSCQNSTIMDTSYSTDLLDTIGHDTDVFSLGSPLPLGSRFPQDCEAKMNSNRQAQFPSFNRPHHMAVDSNINTLPRRFSDTHPSPMHLMQSRCPLPTQSTPNMPSTPTLPAQQYPSSSVHHSILPVASMLSSSMTQRQESSSLSNYKLQETIALASLSSPTSSPPSTNNKLRRTSITSSSSHINNDDGGVILTPTPNDILFGRGKPMRNHPGNVKFRNLLELYHDKYNNAQKFEKGMIVKKLVQTLTETGSRFLKPKITTTNEINKNSNSSAAVTAAAIATGVGVEGWVIVDERTAETKVSQYFRSRRPTKQSNKRKG